MLWGIGIFVVFVLLAIIAHFLLASIGTLSLSFLFSAPSDTSVGGIGPILWNSIYVLVLTLLFTVPLGTLGGIYMAEYAGVGRVTNTIRFAQELMSSVPSIVVGLFGLALFVNATGWGYTAIAGALALTVFNLPLMARLAEQAIRAVPDDERSASLALGATKWATIRHVVLPLAIPGIVTGHHPHGRSHLRRGGCAAVHGRSCDPDELRFLELQPGRSTVAVEPAPARHHPVGLHLEAQLRGAW